MQSWRRAGEGSVRLTKKMADQKILSALIFPQGTTVVLSVVGGMRSGGITVI